ncbi:hypothetical protein ACVILL_005861 [Bradyrhizobium sp. USDA 3364]
MALGRKPVERGLQPVERARAVGDMLGVIVDEILGQAVEVSDADRAAIHLEPALEQLARAGADHVACRRQRHRLQTLAVEHVIERADQIRRGVHQRAVEIEYNDGGREGGHDAFGYRARRRDARVDVSTL